MTKKNKVQQKNLVFYRQKPHLVQSRIEFSESQNNYQRIGINTIDVSDELFNFFYEKQDKKTLMSFSNYLMNEKAPSQKCELHLIKMTENRSEEVTFAYDKDYSSHVGVGNVHNYPSDF